MPIVLISAVLLFLWICLRAERTVFYADQEKQPAWHDGEEIDALPELTGVTSHLSRNADETQWYFWDETQTQCCGPFPSKAEADKGLDRYAKWLSRQLPLVSRAITWVALKFPGRVRMGATRLVILTNSRAYKLPSLFGYKLFLQGLLCNMQEKQFSDAKWPELCPVLWALPGGFLVVMPRANPVSESEWEVFQYDRWVDREDYRVPVENKRDSFGVLRGRLVAIDYGS